MGARTVTGGLLVLLGLMGIYVGLYGRSITREPLEDTVIEAAVAERETSRLLAVLGGIALVTGIVTLTARRDRTPV